MPRADTFLFTRPARPRLPLGTGLPLIALLLGLLLCTAGCAVGTFCAGCPANHQKEDHRFSSGPRCAAQCRAESGPHQPGRQPLLLPMRRPIGVTRTLRGAGSREADGILRDRNAAPRHRRAHYGRGNSPPLQPHGEGKGSTRAGSVSRAKVSVPANPPLQSEIPRAAPADQMYAEGTVYPFGEFHGGRGGCGPYPCQMRLISTLPPHDSMDKSRSF